MTSASSNARSATSARIDRHQQPRPADARRRSRTGRADCVSSCPDDRLVIAESGVREPSTIAGWRALGFDGALVGEALMRSDGRGGERPGLRGGRRGARAISRTSRARRRVKICGIVEPGRNARRRVGRRRCDRAERRSPGTPRGLSVPTKPRISPRSRGTSAVRRRSPAIVAVTADADADQLAAIVRELDPEVVQLSGDEPPELIRAIARPDVEGAAPSRRRPTNQPRRSRHGSSIVRGPTSPRAWNGSSSTRPAGPIPGWDRHARR